MRRYATTDDSLDSEQEEQPVKVFDYEKALPLIIGYVDNMGDQRIALPTPSIKSADLIWRRINQRRKSNELVTMGDQIDCVLSVLQQENPWVTREFLMNQTANRISNLFTLFVNELSKNAEKNE